MFRHCVITSCPPSHTYICLFKVHTAVVQYFKLVYQIFKKIGSHFYIKIYVAKNIRKRKKNNKTIPNSLTLIAVLSLVPNLDAFCDITGQISLGQGEEDVGR